MGLSEAVLADRLRKLVAAGILDTVPYREPGSRTRNEYRLTPKGWDLWPAMIALKQWGDRYTADPEGPPLEVRHRDCDEPVEAVVVCAAWAMTRSHPCRPTPGPAHPPARRAEPRTGRRRRGPPPRSHRDGRRRPLPRAPVSPAEGVDVQATRQDAPRSPMASRARSRTGRAPALPRFVRWPRCRCHDDDGRADGPCTLPVPGSVAPC